METGNKIQGRNPFRVPDNYFEEAKRKIIAKTSGKGHAEDRPGKKFRIGPYLAIAASVAVLVLLSYAGIRHFTNRRDILARNDISRELYMETAGDDINTIILEQNSGTLDIPDLKPQVKSQDIIDYLEQDEININEIYEQL